MIFASSSNPLAYATFRAIVAGPRWGALASRGAHVQRLLWASMAPADPALGEVYYVERLIGRDTVSALSAATLAAFRDHGRAQAIVEDDFPRARAVLQRLLGAGVKVGPLARLLEARGVHGSANAFGEPWAALPRGW